MTTAKNHVVQSAEWGAFKNAYGTKSVRSGNVQYTLHHIPMTDRFYGYCPKVNPFNINYDELKKSLSENNCIALNFDVPDVISGAQNEADAIKIFEKECTISHKETFARYNIILGLDKSEEELLQNMHTKHRYNIRYAQKNGVFVKEGKSDQDFDIFYKLLSETAGRQRYFIHPERYYRMIWQRMGGSGMCRILTAYYKDAPLASWMLFVYDGVLYYPYGGSSDEYTNLYGSNLLGWEVIRLGKKLGCEVFDMWGACSDPENQKDPWWGFTNFKLKFGGKHVKYMDSYDLVVDSTKYHIFNLANDLRWKFLRLVK